MKVQTFVELDLAKTTIVIEFDHLEKLDWDIIKDTVSRHLKESKL